MLLESNARKRKSRAVTVRLPIDVDEEIQKLAKKTNRTVTDVIVEALRFSLEIPA